MKLYEMFENMKEANFVPEDHITNGYGKFQNYLITNVSQFFEDMLYADMENFEIILGMETVIVLLKAYGIPDDLDDCITLGRR